MAVMLTAVATAGGIAIPKLKAIELKVKAPDLDDTANGDGWAVHESGVPDGTCRLMFNQGWGSASVNAILSSKLGQDVTIVAKVSNAPVSASNPQWTFVIRVQEATIFGGQIGDIMTDDVTYPVQGEPIMTTSAFPSGV